MPDLGQMTHALRLLAAENRQIPYGGRDTPNYSLVFCDLASDSEVIAILAVPLC
jgi:hypothetical protein